MTKAGIGKWANAICWGSCGGRCVNKVYVVDGVPVRQKTDDSHPDTPDFPQQRACARGRAYRQMVLGDNRIKHPMKRVHWSPGGGSRELRGRDEWQPISWDEALDLVAGELRRIKQTHGNSAIVSWGQEIGRALSLYGGYVQAWGSTSWGTWLETGPRIGHGIRTELINDRLDLRNCEVIVLWGANPAWSSGGNVTWHYLQAKKAGARFICIDPVFTETAQVLGAEWLPVRPATDHALALGIAYTLLTEDDPDCSPLIDWDFLRRCAVGFDETTVPPGRDPEDNLRDYLLGTSDGCPKTPEWAASITGVDPQRIRWLARQIGCTHKVALLTGWAPARVNNADSWPQVFMALGCMTGHLGLPGHMTGLSTYSEAANGGPPLIRAGKRGVPVIPNPLPVRINNNEIWDAILTGGYTAGKGRQAPVDIRMIYHSGDKARLNQLPGLTKGIEAHRKVEFVVAQDYVFSTQCQYADIVLPVTTHWERFGLVQMGNRESVVLSEKVIEPLYESKDDIWVATELGKRLGLDAAAIDPLPLAQQIYNQLAGAKVVTPDGLGLENLVSITSPDIADMGVKGEPQSGRVALAELREKGVYQVPRSPGDSLGYIAYADFRQDPQANPLPTESGKLEIHCRAIADHVSSCGWSQISPIPVYTRPAEGYEDTFDDFDAQRKGEFPIQLITPHARGRTNSMLDQVACLEEGFPQELMMNTSDAALRGISDGDLVVARSRHGQTRCPVHVSGRVMPGVAVLPEGKWTRMDHEQAIDLEGSANVLVGAVPTGQGQSGWNSCNVEIAKWSGAGGRVQHRHKGALGSHVEEARCSAADHDAFVFDETICTGCKACQIACKDKNGLREGELIRRVECYESGDYPHATICHLSIACKHCKNPACAAVCPVGAISRSEPLGAVIIDPEKCTGCGLCAEACADGGIILIGGKAIKCDLCSDLRPGGEEPACIGACPMRALRLTGHVICL